MRRYETVIIVDPDLSDDVRLPLFDKFRELFPQQEGEVIAFDEWGVQRLAYNIGKKTRGFYIRIDYCGSGKTVNELERMCRLDDKILKYLTVLLEEDTTPEKVREELIRKAEAKAKPPVSDEPPAEPDEAEAPEAAAAPESEQEPDEPDNDTDAGNDGPGEHEEE